MRVAGGKVADRLGGEKTILTSLLITVGGAILLTLSNSLTLALVSVIILALGMGISNAAVFKLVPQEVPQAVGGASGWVGGLGAFGGFTLPPLLGAIVASQGQAGYASGFALFIVLGVLAFGLAALLARKHASEQRSAALLQARMEKHAGH